jgi:small ligand-binding sensory domain FIST
MDTQQVQNIKTAHAKSVIVSGTDWETALQEAIGQMQPFLESVVRVDVLFVFAGAAYIENYADLLQSAKNATKAKHIIGCSGAGIIGEEKEVEDRPALALLALSLPGVELFPVRLTLQDLRDYLSVENLRLPQLSHAGVKGWFVLADPFTMDPEALLSILGEEYPNVPLIGGLASTNMRRTYLFRDEEVYSDGAVLLGIGGAYGLKAVVSQGAMPIGEAWMVTKIEGQVIEEISGKPAYERLAETFVALPPDLQRKARYNLLLGLAIDEYKDTFQRGDFLIRNLAGIDQRTGAIIVGGLPRLGQTLQFQLRDAEAADEDLNILLAKAKAEFENIEPLAGLLFSCNGRGANLFGETDHDAKAVAQYFQNLPVAGFFCNGEIGPIGGKNFLHGFTASIGMIVRSN